MKRITTIMDWYEGTFVIFYRDDPENSKVYYRPTEASMQRYALAVQKLWGEGRVTCYRAKEENIWRMEISYEN